MSVLSAVCGGDPHRGHLLQSTAWASAPTAAIARASHVQSITYVAESTPVRRVMPLAPTCCACTQTPAPTSQSVASCRRRCSSVMTCVTSRRDWPGCTASFRAAQQGGGAGRLLLHRCLPSASARGAALLHPACHPALQGAASAAAAAYAAAQTHAMPSKPSRLGWHSLRTCFSLGTTWNWLVVALMMATFSSCQDTERGAE